MRILGISAFYHDSAAALIEDGNIIAAAQEERFTRKKHDPGFPTEAISYCLEAANIDLKDIDHVVFFEKPFLKFERLLETYLARAPKGFTSFKMAMPVWIKDKLFQKDKLIKLFESFENSGDIEDRILFAEHHQSHSASAFFPSPFEEAVILTMDGVGEWATASVAIGRGNTLTTVKEIQFPHSLGLLYSAITYYTGFRVNSGEYKVMGLAPYGEPKYVDLIKNNLIDIKEDGSYWLDQSYFNYATGLTMTSSKFHDLFGAPPRTSEEQITQREMDLAASVQAITEEVMLKMAASLAKEYGIPNLCLAGGVALNCVANGKIIRDGSFENVWVQPAAGDAGGALGAALAAYYIEKEQPRTINPDTLDNMQGSYLGPEYEQSDIEQCLTKAGAIFEVFEEPALMQETAKCLEDGHAIGWFQGRMEFGPRALGGRSILGDPRNPKMQKTLNLKIKYRESFRPFAPSILASEVGNYFDHEEISPYMLVVAPVKEQHRIDTSEEDKGLFGIEKLNIPRSTIPAITHVDYSARIQTVHEATNPRYHALITAFNELSGCPIVVNTSFNVRGEPIVNTPEDAFHCFMGTEMDTLVIGNCLMRKPAQDQSLAQDYKDKFDLD